MKISEDERKQALEIVCRGLALAQMNFEAAIDKEHTAIAKACYEAFKCLWDMYQG